ncbi:hypothetical protein [Azospirillum sp. B2RO_4]|uniref:hypothetical protein n=1 Tax=Azospirillum sp. B2RO_4 TaxID=3027796 RepID=UPI003DA8FBE2
MKPLLILGSGAALSADVAALGDWPGPVMAVNRAGAFYPGRLDHWATLHPDRLGAFVDERRTRGLPFEGQTWSLDAADGVRIDRVVTDLELSGSSGLFAVRIALHRLGHKRVVLAGVPIDNGRHFYDGARRSGPGFVGYRLEWRRAARGEFDGRVRSLSGWTADLLGRPDPAWLEG